MVLIHGSCGEGCHCGGDSVSRSRAAVALRLRDPGAWLVQDALGRIVILSSGLLGSEGEQS